MPSGTGVDYCSYAGMQQLLRCSPAVIRGLESAVKSYIKYHISDPIPTRRQFRETWEAVEASHAGLKTLPAGNTHCRRRNILENDQHLDEMKRHIFTKALEELQTTQSDAKTPMAEKLEVKRRWLAEHDQDDEEPTPVKRIKTEAAHTAEAQKQPPFQTGDVDQRTHFPMALHSRVSDMEPEQPHSGNNNIIEQSASRPIAPQIVSPAIEEYHPMEPGQKQAPLPTALQSPGSLEELLMSQAQKSAGETVLAVEAHIKAAVDERVREQNARLKDDRLALNRAEARRIMGEAALEEARAEYETKKTADIDMLAEREQLLMKREENMAELRKENAECKARCDSLEATLKTTSKRLKEANEKEARLSDLAAKHAKAVEDFKRAIQ